MKFASPADMNMYNRFVHEQHGSFLQSEQWGQWQAQLGHKVARFMVTDNSPLLTGQAVQMLAPRLGKHYLYIPYGPLLKQGLSKNEQESVTNFFIGQLKQNYRDALFIRIEPPTELHIAGKPTLHIQPGKTLLLDLLKSPEKLLAEMHHKTRYNIKVAERHGIQVISDPIIKPGQGLQLEEVVNLLVQTSQRQQYRNHSVDYFRKFINFFTLPVDPQACHAVVYKAIYQNRLLAAAIMVDFGQTRTYLFGGTADEHKNLMAPYALHWQAIQDARNAGKISYDFWGVETASGNTPGFVRFKLGWGGRQVQYPQPFDIVQRPLWYNLYAILRSVNRKLK